MQDIVLITPCRITQIKHGNVVSVILFCDSSVISNNIALAVGIYKTHTACTGKFQIWVQKKSGFSYARCAHHKGMNIALVNKSNSLFSRTSAPYDSALNRRQIHAPTPFLRFERQRNKSLFYL